MDNLFDYVLKYKPYLYEDKNEPFKIHTLGYYVYTKNQKSVSFNRDIVLSENGKMVIEYILYWTYDIQHLYDLEHIFVEIDNDDNIIKVETSFHGLLFNSNIKGMLEFYDKTRPILYLQPGKHAPMCNPLLFNLYIGLYDNCNKYAGKDGLLVPEFLSDDFSKFGLCNDDEKANEIVLNYIKDNYSFVPSMEFVKTDDYPIISWQELRPLIISDIVSEMSNICK